MQTIYNKVENYFQGSITPEKIARTSEAELRSLGLSFRKIEYIQLLSASLIEGSLNLDILPDLADEDAISLLVGIKGIGRWTAEMFLMFALGRENVFSSGDFGLRKALSLLHGKDLSVKEADELSQKWDPYKSVVSHFLWNYL